MNRQDRRLHSLAYCDASDSLIPIDTLIWSGLRRVFPLPAECQKDDAFQVLLNALARRHGAVSRQASTSVAGAGS
jgi:hypothetical protein